MSVLHVVLHGSLFLLVYLWDKTTVKCVTLVWQVTNLIHNFSFYYANLQIIHTFDLKLYVSLTLTWPCDVTGIRPCINCFKIVEFDGDIAFRLLIMECFNSVLVLWTLDFNCFVANYVKQFIAFIVSPVYTTLNFKSFILKLTFRDRTWQESRVSNKTPNCDHWRREGT